MTFQGVLPILATPFHPDESLDLNSWVRLIDFVVSLGVDGATILGVLGEANRLSERERTTLIRAAIAAADGRIPIIVGTSHAGTEAMRSLSLEAERLGASAVMVAPGKEPVPNDDRTFEVYQRLGDSLTVPIVVQDHPASTEVHMSVGLLRRLLDEVPLVRCIKAEAVPTAPKIRALRSAVVPGRVQILTGLGGLYAPFDLEAGADGFNTGFAFPEVLLAMWRAARLEDWARVYEIYSWFAPLIVFEQQPGVAIRKELLRRRGLFVSAGTRHPGAGLSTIVSAQLDLLLQRIVPECDITKPLPVDELVSRGGAHRMDDRAIACGNH